MRQIGLASLILSLALASGCHVSCCSKRVSEKNCPTDIRKTHCWCFGEDALFRFPCGPNAAFYGHKPTCWREWPTSASHWRDIHCGPLLPPLGPGMVPAVPVMVPVERKAIPPVDGQAAPPVDGEAAPPVEGQAVPPVDGQAVPSPTETQPAPPDSRPLPEQSETPDSSEPAPEATPDTSIQFDESNHHPNELPQSLASASAMRPAESAMPPAEIENCKPADHPAAQPDSAPSPLKTWRALQNDDKPSALEFQRWPAFEATTTTTAEAPTCRWIVIEQSDTAARQESAIDATVIAGAASEHASDAIPADHDKPHVIIDDSIQDSWRKSEPRSTETAHVISAPELPSEKPSIQMKTSAALQRLMTHETEDAAAE